MKNVWVAERKIYTLALIALCLSSNLLLCLGSENGNVNNDVLESVDDDASIMNNTRRNKFVADLRMKLSNDHRSRAKTMQRRWRRTFKEIKALVAPKQGNIDSTMFFEQWKLLLERGPSEGRVQNDDENRSDEDVSPTVRFRNELISEKRNLTKTLRQRFDGFATWEARLQQWSDEASSFYISSGKLEESEEHSFSRYGRPMEHNDSSTHSSIDEDSNGYKTNFVPRPVIAGEDVVSHTDISDKSKNIWIVTTASLPWMTGTAVNALLRAAYLTTGRSKMGGGVTLMLPWLERESDQEQLYGKDRVFSSPEEQEVFVRKWLRETAKFPQAATDLNLAWYTGKICDHKWISTVS